MWAWLNHAGPDHERFLPVQCTNSPKNCLDAILCFITPLIKRRDEVPVFCIFKMCLILKVHPIHVCWTCALPWMLCFILRGGKYWCIAPQWWSKLISQSTGPNYQGILKIQISTSFLVIFYYKWRQGWWVLMQQGRQAVPTKNTKSDVQQIMCWEQLQKCWHQTNV